MGRQRPGAHVCRPGRSGWLSQRIRVAPEASTGRGWLWSVGSVPGTWQQNQKLSVWTM